MSDQIPVISKCPVCGYEMDAATAVGVNEGRKPVPGDISLCFKCGEILQFDKDLKLEFVTLERMMALPFQTFKLIERAQDMVRAKRYCG